MEIDEFGLERWFDAHEHDAEVMLAESGVRPLPAARFDTEPDDLGYVIPTDGDPEFRAEVAADYGRDAEEVVFTCGTQEANLLVFLALLSAGDRAVVVTPTYQSLVSVPDALCAVTEVSLSPPDWRLDPDAVVEAIGPDVELVVVNNPNNPTGRYHDADAIRAIREAAVDAGARLLCDEVYRDLADDPLPPVGGEEGGVSTTSLSKAYGLAGLRFGWLVADREVADAARRWKDYTTISPSAVGQHVARQALAERASILAESRALAAEHRGIVADWVDRHGLDWLEPVGVNAFPTVPDGFADGTDFCRAAVEEGVVLAPGEYFGHPDRFRLGFGLPTAALHEGLARVDRAIEAV
jgi:aspartate/methionine/tyrosine aminotransferase